MAPAVVSPLYRYYRINSIQNRGKSDTKTPDLQNVNKKYIFQQNDKSFCPAYLTEHSASLNIGIWYQSKLPGAWIEGLFCEKNFPGSEVVCLTGRLPGMFMDELVKILLINCEKWIRSQCTAFREDQQFITIAHFTFSPVHRARKFSAVLGVVSPKSPIVMRPADTPAISISKYTVWVI